eukprot:2506966-Pleurochrysis_carterae.AAC.1
MVKGKQRRRGANSPARWLRCGGAARRRQPRAHGGKEAYRAERERCLREYTSNANAKIPKESGYKPPYKNVADLIRRFNN